MVQYGADAVFKSAKGGDEDFSEVDIDAILAAGEAKTKTLTDAIALKVGASGGGMLDLKFDGAAGGVQEFEGKDYSRKAAAAAEARLGPLRERYARAAAAGVLADSPPLGWRNRRLQRRASAIRCGLPMRGSPPPALCRSGGTSRRHGPAWRRGSAG